MRTDRLKREARDLLVSGHSAARSRTTSRSTLAALGEYARRAAGDAPPVPPSATLSGHELKVFSQNGEDGVLAECLRRTGSDSRSFVEFGASSGIEGSCVALADILGWSGLFIEADKSAFARLEGKYSLTHRVVTKRSMVTEHNVEQLFTDADVPENVDVVSIDVDGADYWIWSALRSYRPRIVVIEYNSSLGGERALVQPRRRSDGWDRTEYFGASITALRELGREKSYRLVHTELTGVNAFFVRDDLPGPWPDDDVVPLRGVNLFLAGARHDADTKGRSYVDPRTELPAR